MNWFVDLAMMNRLLIFIQDHFVVIRANTS